MKFYKVFIVLFIFMFINIAVVSASDLNSTDNNISLNESSHLNVSETKTFVKTTPSITIESNNINCKDPINLYLKNTSKNSLKSKQLFVSIDNKKYVITTNSQGVATLKINLQAKTYKLTVLFNGDSEYNSISKNFNIKVSKISTKIMPSGNFAVKNNKLYFYLMDASGNAISHKKITLKLNGKTYTRKSNSNGRVAVKINYPKSKYLIKVKFKEDKQFKPYFLKLKFYVTDAMALKIANTKLITNGYLRVYLKHPYYSVNNKNIKLLIGNKKINKKTNYEGIAVFKPNVHSKHYIVKVKFGKYYSSKSIKCYEGNVKDPLKEYIPLKNGVPDLDWMPANYVMGDENAKYTLKKSQYLDVLRRDSYCLFLHNKLTKYIFFKTKFHPNTNHIIKRSKWNVIEREINKKLVKANKHNYWPSKITVSLKGKSYVYPEVRDVQNTGYTCGPTSGSVCSQVLKNYVSEKYLAKLAGTNKKEGTKCSGIKRALEKNNFNCTFYYKHSFTNALNELKTGGTALVFHANKHYVAILDISKDGKKVLVSNSYGTYDNIPTKWLKVSYMRHKFSQWEESLIVKLNYKLSDSTKSHIFYYYNSFGTGWSGHNNHQSIGRV